MDDCYNINVYSLVFVEIFIYLLKINQNQSYTQTNKLVETKIVKFYDKIEKMAMFWVTYPDMHVYQLFYWDSQKKKKKTILLCPISFFFPISSFH